MRKYLFLLSCCLPATPALAQDSSQTSSATDDYIVIADTLRPAETSFTITVTGNRSEVEDTGQAVTVIGEDEIEEVQGADLTRILRRSPGVTLTRNGGVGAFSTTRVRGAPGEQLLVLIDGVEVSDPASPGGGFDFGNLLAGNIAKLDLLRGSNSTIWGSDAIGGVLAVTTDTQEGAEGSVEYGARDTLLATAAAGTGIGDDAGFVGLSGSYFTTDGFSAAASGTEPDGFEQWAVNGQARAYLSYELEMFARARYAEGDLEVDGFPAPAFALGDTDEFQKTRQYSASAGALYQSEALLLRGTYSFADTERANFNPAFGSAPGFTADGHSDRLEFRGEWRAIGPVLVNFGAEQEWTAFETNFDARQTTDNTAAYAQLGIEFGALSAHAGARHDDDARFGGATSFGADVTYRITDDWRVSGSIGEGFKAPTLFQELSDFGNTALLPEQSTSFDLGVRFGNRAAPGRGYASANLFRRDSENLIDFVSCFGSTDPICTGRPFGTYDNVGSARAQGVELEAGYRAGAGVTTRFAYAFVDTENRTSGDANNGNRLARQPRHAGTFSADWDTAPDTDGGLTLGADMRYVSTAFDNAANSTALDGYLLLDLRANLELTQLGAGTLDLFGRAENISDVDYQTAAGFASPGRGVFVGLRAEM